LQPPCTGLSGCAIFQISNFDFRIFNPPIGVLMRANQGDIQR
jgi:hypothetical protein